MKSSASEELIPQSMDQASVWPDPAIKTCDSLGTAWLRSSPPPRNIGAELL